MQVPCFIRDDKNTHILYCRFNLSDRSNMQEVESDEYIKLEQAMKLAGAVSMGSSQDGGYRQVKLK